MMDTEEELSQETFNADEMEETTDQTSSKDEDSPVPETPVNAKPQKETDEAQSEVTPTTPGAVSRYGRSRKPKESDYLVTSVKGQIDLYSQKKISPKLTAKKSARATSMSSKRSATSVESRKPGHSQEEDSVGVEGLVQHSDALLVDENTTVMDSLDEDGNDTADETANDTADELLMTDDGTELEDQLDEPTTEYLPGDLMWGRVGQYPFWPCIIIDDPVFNTFYKTSGRGRLQFHVMFYGDNGKRGWVKSAMVLRFFGLDDFEQQAAAITPEMRKKDPRVAAFFVHPKHKAQWEIAVSEAEAAMPMTRDERLDAFIAALPQKPVKRQSVGKHLRKSENLEDLGHLDADTPTDGKEEDGSKMRGKPLIDNKGDTPTEVRKRGRPRKSVIPPPNPEAGTAESSVSKEKDSAPGRPRKRKLEMEDDDELASKKVLLDNEEPSYEDTVSKRHGKQQTASASEKIRKKKSVKKDLKLLDEQAFELYSKKHFDRALDNHPDLGSEEVKKYLRSVWDSRDEDEKSIYYSGVAEKRSQESSTDENSSDEGEDTDRDSKDDRTTNGAEMDTPVEDSSSTNTVAAAKRKINIFRGYRMERVCQVCEKSGNTIKCRGPCAGVFHVECARGADNSEVHFQIVEGPIEKPKRRGRKKKIDSLVQKMEAQKAKQDARQKMIYASEESDSDLDYNEGGDLKVIEDHDFVMKMIMGDASSNPVLSVLVEDDSDDAEEDEEDSGPRTQVGDFRCGDCAVLRTPLCFSCGQATDPSGEDSNRHRCSVGHCGKHFHGECLKTWPQSTFSLNNGAVQNLTCPQHVCHTCVSDNPRECKGRFTQERLVKCIRCPTAYHYGNYCIPAGTEILTATQIICPRHYEAPKKGNHHINASWCFICAVGGSLICCDLCPASFHVDCLKIKPPSGSFICEDCETGRFPLFSEVVWVKLGNYRWWPSITLFPSEVPDNVQGLPHSMGEFVVRFLGTKDHYWIQRGRCFIFHEGDTMQDRKVGKTQMDADYQTGLKEATDLHKAHKELRAIHQTMNKSGVLKPPQYVKIKTNKPIGSVKMFELDTSNIAACECDPKSEHPCSADSQCLNRILSFECDPNLCPAGDRCENQYFEKRLYPALEPYRTEARGWGLRALGDIKKGSFIIEYVGEVIDDEEYQRRLRKKHEEKDENYYFLTIDSYRMIDAGPKGNVSRFMNHSCQPNCETQKWTVAGDTRVGLFALHDIPAGSELTFNYNLESKGNEKKPCMCGAMECSGFIGAKKVKNPSVETKGLVSSAKKKRRKSRLRNLNEEICLTCNFGTEVGELISCANKECATQFHLACVKLEAAPEGKWLCARHQCNTCSKRCSQWCSYCTESYCPQHIDGNLVSDPLHGLICNEHEKNPIRPASMDDSTQNINRSILDEHKKQQDKRKQEEEKRKREEEERAQRRSRREQAVTEEKVSRKKRKRDTAGQEDTVSETSSEGTGEDKPSSDDKTIEMSDEMKDESKVLNREEIQTKEDSTNHESVTTENAENCNAESSPASEVTEMNVDHDVKEGKEAGAVMESYGDKKEPTNTQEISNVETSQSDETVDSIEEQQITKESLTEGGTSKDSEENKGTTSSNSLPDDDKGTARRASNNHVVSLKMDVEDPVVASVKEDDSKDEIPDADPSFDKFIPTSPQPLDESDKVEAFENMETAPVNNSVLVHKMSDSGDDDISPKKKKRPLRKSLGPRLHIPKRPVKDHKESHFNRSDLSNELKDLASTFGADKQDKPCHEVKKISSRGRGRLGNQPRSRGHSADSSSTLSSNETFEVSQMSIMEDSPQSPSSRRKSSTSSPSNGQFRPGSPEALSASKLLAMQRAKGLKVMPPNRRLSTAREKAVGSTSEDSPDELTEKVERAGKGLKVLKGRRMSVEASVSVNRTENLHSEALQSSVSKRVVRPVLTKVEDNGASLEEEEKVNETVLSSTQKRSTPRSKTGPGSKKNSPASNKKPPADLGVCPLWNQDIMGIMGIQ